jgi:hypothetical protein
MSDNEDEELERIIR